MKKLSCIIGILSFIFFVGCEASRQAAAERAEIAARAEEERIEREREEIKNRVRVFLGFETLLITNNNNQKFRAIEQRQ